MYARDHRRLARGAWAYLFPLLVLLAGAARAASRGRVVLLRAPPANPSARQSETLLAAELRAARFEVAERERTVGLDLRADLEAAGAALRPLAVLAIAPGPEVWLLDRQTGNLVIRRIEPPSAPPADVALRAVELVRGTLLEMPALAREPPPTAAPVEVVAVASPPPPRPPHVLQGPAVGAAATALGVGTALGPSYAPALRVSYGFQRPIAVRLTAVGLGGGRETRALDGGALLGTAEMHEGLLLVEALGVFRRGARLQPFVDAGLGVHQAMVEGKGASPLFPGHSARTTGLALAAGVGLALRLGSRAALLAEATLVAVSPTTTVRIADQEAAHLGRPAPLLSLGMSFAP